MKLLNQVSVDKKRLMIQEAKGYVISARWP
jgi:hypothetical protein